MKKIAFFSNRVGVGTTSLVYHLALTFSDSGVRVLAVDKDPQADLTAMFLTEDQSEQILAKTKRAGARNEVENIGEHLRLLPWQLGGSVFEEVLSSAWKYCDGPNEVAFKTVTYFHRMIEEAARDWAEVVLIDMGPNLGAINRAALLAADYICFPLADDLQSIEGLRHAGPCLTRWGNEWQEMKVHAPAGLSIPLGAMTPLGYVLVQPGGGSRKDEIPVVYRTAALEDIVMFGTYSVRENSDVPRIKDDPHCLARLRHYESLMPLATAARKPMFRLTLADGATGAHVLAVQDCRGDFMALARRIGAGVGILAG